MGYISPTKVAQIVTLREEGKTIHDIAERVGKESSNPFRGSRDREWEDKTSSEILPCRGRRVGTCRTCKGEMCTGCVCVLHSHLNLAICICLKYLLTFS